MTLAHIAYPASIDCNMTHAFPIGGTPRHQHAAAGKDGASVTCACLRHAAGGTGHGAHALEVLGAHVLHHVGRHFHHLRREAHALCRSSQGVKAEICDVVQGTQSTMSVLAQILCYVPSTASGADAPCSNLLLGFQTALLYTSLYEFVCRLSM